MSQRLLEVLLTSFDDVEADCYSVQLLFYLTRHHTVISALLFACLYRMLLHLSFFLQFSLLIFSFENRPTAFTGQFS